jgi:hypothetical protein
MSYTTNTDVSISVLLVNAIIFNVIGYIMRGPIINGYVGRLFSENIVSCVSFIKRALYT